MQGVLLLTLMLCVTRLVPDAPLSSSKLPLVGYWIPAVKAAKPGSRWRLSNFPSHPACSSPI
jgi:hypothetical protein